MLGADNPVTLVWMALACASVSYTLTKTPMFLWVAKRFQHKPSGWMFQLWTCPYCMGHWVAFAMVAAVQPKPFAGGWVDLPLAAFAVVTLSMFFVQLIILMGEVFKCLRAYHGD